MNYNDKKNSDINSRIKKTIETHGGNLNKVARICGLSQPTLQAAADGSTKNFGINIVAGLINGLNLSKEDVYWILTGKKTPEAGREFPPVINESESERIRELKDQIEAWKKLCSLLECQLEATKMQGENQPGHNIGLQEKAKPVSTAPK